VAGATLSAMGSYWSIEKCGWVEHETVVVAVPQPRADESSHDDAAEPAVEELLAQHGRLPV